MNEQKASVLEVTKSFIEDLNKSFLSQGGIISAEEKDLLLEAANQSMKLRELAKASEQIASLK